MAKSKTCEKIKSVELIMKHAAMIIKSFAFCVEREQHLAGASNDFFFALVGRLISRRRIGFSEAFFSNNYLGEC